jgi:hypothetical protein
MEEKPIDNGPIQYMGGHKAYPSSGYTWIFFYEDRLFIDAYNLTVYYSKIKDVFNTSEKRRHAERLALGLVILPLALTYLWKKNHIYTILEYEDGHDTQRIVIDFMNKVDHFQSLIYSKMLEFRNKDSQEPRQLPDNKAQTDNTGSPIKS